MLTQAGDASLRAPFIASPARRAGGGDRVGLVGWAVVQTDWVPSAPRPPWRMNLQGLATRSSPTMRSPFEIISLLLLAAIIGAIFLARRPEEDERS